MADRLCGRLQSGKGGFDTFKKSDISPPGFYINVILMFKHYLQEALEPTLLFGSLNCILGIIVASFYTKIDILTAILLIVGIFFAHISVNVLDDYVDYKRGIDSETTKTKFSGGSSLIVNGSLKAEQVLLLGLFSFVIAAIIGIYLIIL